MLLWLWLNSVELTFMGSHGAQHLKLKDLWGQDPSFTLIMQP